MFDITAINKNIPVPLYYQLKNIILDLIKGGKLQPGDALPTELELQTTFEISRTTVRQAMMELVSEGYLTRVKSKGTFVAKPKITQGFLHRLESFQDQMASINMTPKTVILNNERCMPNEEIRHALDIEPELQIIWLRRVRYADNEPIVFVDSYLTPNCSPILDLDMSQRSLYTELRKNESSHVVRVVRQIESVGANLKTAEYLGIPFDAHIQLTKTTGYNRFGKPVEYSVARYSGAKNRFVVELSL